MTHPVPARIGRLCEQIAPLLDDTGREAAAGIRQGLSEPLRLAVVGRVKAGKSTLVNALVGRRIAPTSAGECTRVVTWYRYGAPERAELQMRDGTHRDLALVDGRLPEHLLPPPAGIARIVVHLQAGALREHIVIDTPGLATLTAGNEAATREAVLGAADAETGQADAVLFVFREAERHDEVAFLQQFRAATGELGAGAVNAIGVLSQADLFDGAGVDDPFDAADAQAARLAAARATDVSAVVAVSGLLAETARTGRIREQDARTLAAAADVPEQRLRLRHRLPLPDGVDAGALERLYPLLGNYGVHRGREEARAGAHRLVGWMESVSGIGRVEHLLRRGLLNRAHALKAVRALTVLTRAAQRAGADAALALIEEARLDPELHPVRELRALRSLVAEAPASPLRIALERVSADTTDAARLGLPGDATPGQIAAAAREAGAAAQSRAAFALMPAEVEAGRVLARSYQLIARRAAS
ncbi:isoniazid inducible gene protein IniC [Actinoplanes italicus]|uniref:Dynamin family protein n=1 Tax=Actinoplanes italicus TaxID=113567 RepID=A0A2T0KGF7_9ACTN|nr:dynamin family protein [Actinoplanes italicus]PRX22516.1 dynamin family protein [Actinoplanes italicus]GIE36930.1 isoniazid inducible gene protein IniC [Actinoplanes italicus]